MYDYYKRLVLMSKIRMRMFRNRYGLHYNFSAVAGGYDPYLQRKECLVIYPKNSYCDILSQDSKDGENIIGKTKSTNFQNEKYKK